MTKEKEEKEALAIRIGKDGYYLLNIVELPDTPQYIKKIESLEILRQIWLQQYYCQGEQIQWREPQTLGLPPNQILIQSPLDIEARNRTKRELNGTGYAVHFTETCDNDTLHLITNVETTTATISDEKMTVVIEEKLAQKELLPSQLTKNTCLGCPSRPLCASSKNNPRVLKIRPQKEFEILQKMKQEVDGPDFKKLYHQRAGIEGTMNQGTRSFGLRHSRYIGLAKTHLQNTHNRLCYQFNSLGCMV